MKILHKLGVVLLISSTLSGCWTVSNGEKIGTIVKISKEGLLIKTNEAELIRGGMNNGSGSFGRPFDFTIESEDMLKTANFALENAKEVKIKYHQELATMWRCKSNNYFLDSIEIINKDNKG
jgi:hypothetical protein